MQLEQPRRSAVGKRNSLGKVGVDMYVDIISTRGLAYYGGGCTVSYGTVEVERTGTLAGCRAGTFAFASPSQSFSVSLALFLLWAAKKERSRGKICSNMQVTQSTPNQKRAWL